MVSKATLESPDSYGVAWIAALPIERSAAEAMLDEEHEAPTGFTRHKTDANVYSWGRVGKHNIVIAGLSPGSYGPTAAATTASSVLASLPSIRVGLLVGIGAGIPRPDDGYDIRLGDVVVSQPHGSTGGVCQYDFVKVKPGHENELNGFLGRPPLVLLNALGKIQAEHYRKDSEIPRHLREMLEKYPKMKKSTKQNPGFTHQGVENDRLFKTLYDHVRGPDCRGCDTANEVERDIRDIADPEIHYGTIASGSRLIKFAAARDQIIANVGTDCICFEMEAAGLMNHFPCLVIRGICDYADSHKNDRWQSYASATAAAYTKELLSFVPVSEVQETQKALELLQKVDQNIEAIQQTTVATEATTNFIRSDLHIDKIKRWLSPPDQSTNFNHAKKLRHEGTGAWLLKDPVFESWHLGSRRHLWLKGLAGCGKTFLSTTVLDHLAKVNNGPILSFFFDFSDTAKQTFDGMLRSFIFQLYQGGFDSASHLDTLFESHQRGSNQAATKNLEDMLSKMLMTPKLVFIVLDALDESTTRVDLLLWIKDMISSPGLAHVKLLYTSRPEAEFLDHIPPSIGEESCLLLNEEAVNIDIQSWVAAQLTQRCEFTRKSLSQDFLTKIRETIGNKAAGMFRWAFCQLNSLARCHSQYTMEKALETLPRDLNETYERMLAGIPTELAIDALRLLQFLVHTAHPLTVDQAKEVIATQIDNQPRGFDTNSRPFSDIDVLNYCPSLVTLVDIRGPINQEKELHLAHFSVKEYLLDLPPFEVTTASISMTGMCLTYLRGVTCFSIISDTSIAITRHFPMASHAAHYWARYASFAQTSKGLMQMMVRFLEEESTFQLWGRLYQPDQPGVNEPVALMSSRLYKIAFVGLALLAHEFIDKGADVNAQVGLYGNALQAACIDGYRNIEVVELLITKGADINAQGGYYGTALQAACISSHQEIVQLLLNKGADINAQGGAFGTALQAACKYNNQEIVQLLLNRGADINAQGGYYDTALQAACVNSCQEIVKLLLNEGADINAQGGYYGTALQAACISSHREIVQLLLNKGADINAYSGYYSTALQAACVNGDQEIVKLLLNKGADINAYSGYYSTALQATCAYNHREIAELLLNEGADINTQGGHYGTALHAACAFNHREIAELLLNKGADVDVQGGFFGDALQVAYTRGHHESVEMPRSKGVIKMPSKRPSSLTPTSPTKKLCPGDESSDDFQQAIN
ncbi:Pfs NACHT and Ankyrin domain protein [Penicillium brevicompactum]|uniref:Pfs NACHT and Ankyrin domain protein n=1 Tax=Penicillium brevicompactum TaxID=5074 RepID=UPI0025403A12|nr:Pfs NACHT and Ankyrin domain protein [Penicillium brevicompactum]KAJ5318963.1 Pfs NACHT and Ankyrin domain protein [Penicillium brevicompactum]